MILHEKYLCTELPVTGAHKTSKEGRREYFKQEVLWIKWRRVLKVAWSPEKEQSRAHSRKFVFVLRNAWRPNSVVIRGVTIGSIISRGLTGEGGTSMPSTTPSLTLTHHTWHWLCVSKVLEATSFARLRTLERCRVSSKVLLSPPRVRNQD